MEYESNSRLPSLKSAERITLWDDHLDGFSVQMSMLWMFGRSMKATTVRYLGR